MKKKSALIIVALLSLLPLNCTKAQKDLKRDDGLKNTYVIKGASVTSEMLSEAKFCTAWNVHKADTPDSELTIYIPGINEIIATKNSILPTLFTSVDSFAVNGTDVTREEFYATNDQMLTSVELKDNKLYAFTRENVNDSNPTQEQSIEDFRQWLLETTPSATIPDSIVIDQPLTMPSNSIINLDWIMITPEKADKIKTVSNLCFILDLVGNIPQLTLLSTIHPDEVDKVASEGGKYRTMAIPTTEFKTRSVKEIREYGSFAPEDIKAITTNGRYITIILKEGK